MTASGIPSIAGPGSEDLQKRFIAKFKNDSVSVGLSYANAQILCMAIERAGSLKPENVRDAVFGKEFKGTIMGDVKYNEKGLAFTPLLAMQWYEGRRGCRFSRQSRLDIQAGACHMVAADERNGRAVTTVLFRWKT